MRLASPSGLLATTLAIGAIATPSAQAGGLFSGPAPDPPGAAQWEAQAFERLYHVSNSNPVPVSGSTASAPRDGFDYGDAAVGVGVVGGLALLLTSGTLSVRRRVHVRDP